MKSTKPKVQFKLNNKPVAAEHKQNCSNKNQEEKQQQILPTKRKLISLTIKTPSKIH